MKSIVTTFFLFYFVIGYSQKLEQKQIIDVANDMLISTDFEIKSIVKTKKVNDFQVVSIEIPYREFPSIIIFKYNSSKETWIRIFETLSPGIQNKPSGLLDWHTKGLGIDFLIDNQTIYDFNDNQVKIMIDAMNENNGILIPYQNFMHFHSSDSSSLKEFNSYTIDKTNYYDYANVLFEDLYKNYPTNECIMFDSPKILELDFKLMSGLYTLIVKTNNNQVWTYKFKDVDSDYKYLIGKSISVEKAL